MDKIINEHFYKLITALIVVHFAIIIAQAAP